MPVSTSSPCASGSKMGVVFEAVGHHMVALLAGTRVQFGERFAHAARISLTRIPVEGLVVQRLGDTAPPIGQIKHDGTCQLRSLFIDRSNIGPCIQQTGERFVNVIHGTHASFIEKFCDSTSPTARRPNTVRESGTPPTYPRITASPANDCWHSCHDRTTVAARSMNGCGSSATCANPTQADR